jgi:hypothetical protein
MKRIVSLALGCVAMVAAAPVIAKPGHGNGQGNGRGIEMREMGRMNSRGPDHASDRGLERSNDEHSVLSALGIDSDTSVSQRRLNSRGALHASARAHARANRHSAIHGTTVVTRTTPTRTRTRRHR